MSFGLNLEKLRKEHKISQSKLGSTLGITQQMISSYEKDISSPNIDTLVKIADYFEISIDRLVGHIIKSENPESPKVQFDRLFDSLSAQDKEQCLLIIKTLILDRDISTDKVLFKKTS
ncbi:helix-turn-helix domain-containing protein [Anaerocolumna sp. MB42-C2]|uniref:helix-turn-helix domain-containing protein n=1 Tax=Anaerocolumna sp. MB42-C2 TaxID=3070997 RepID=UPI0027E19357|nr:helix-turn-helix transcriptional regulator [Anaerocolumna sp. MB42-C2]WMJ85682.1 helix-turn-helix transcriptional regulator [Anaerocolumna sp. MB42-C2]